MSVSKTSSFSSFRLLDVEDDYFLSLELKNTTSNEDRKVKVECQSMQNDKTKGWILAKKSRITKNLKMQHNYTSQFKVKTVLKQKTDRYYFKHIFNWELSPDTTYGEIRSYIANYFGIDPCFIEIWLNNISNTRGMWNETIQHALSNGESLNLKFEIVSYNTEIYDQIEGWCKFNININETFDAAKYNISICGSSSISSYTFSIIYKKVFIAKEFINYIIDFWWNHPLQFNLISFSIVDDLKSLPIHRKSNALSKDFYFFDVEYQAIQIALLPFVKYSSAMARVISDFTLWRHARISAEDFCVWQKQLQSPMPVNVRYMEQNCNFALNNNINLHVLLRNDPLRISNNSNGNKLMDKTQSSVAVIVQFRCKLHLDNFFQDEVDGDVRIVINNKETLEDFLFKKLLPYLVNRKIIDKYRRSMSSLYHYTYPKYCQIILKLFIEKYTIGMVTRYGTIPLPLELFLDIAIGGMEKLMINELNFGSFLQLIIERNILDLSLNTSVMQMERDLEQYCFGLMHNSLRLIDNIGEISSKKKDEKCVRRTRFQPRKKSAEKRNYCRRPKKQKMQKYHRIRW